MKQNLYSLTNSFVFNPKPVSENEAIRVSRWLDKRLKRLNLNYYSVSYRGDGKDGFYIEVTDRNIIDAITPNPMENSLPKHR